ncbi:MAG: Rieske (2Fe-2S) protein [Pirellulaceae bacterium]
MSRFVEVARLSELPDGSSRLIVRDDLWIGLFRADGTVYAIEAHCPHAGANLVRGEFQSGCLTCPVHLWRFRLADGQYLDADQPQFNLTTYRVRLSGDEIWVELPGESATDS